ncbi:hypothetical protein V2S66_31550 [Streptomyces sp. V4-01]|uniref:Uncharacterized protein n=1 Tax=Actinacidiphila polyblastidii TaxID=3110430 RepID=A0ABU7PKY0_9ACTN|nr:hypothetical protein [Streptomyces sp. V4-01]
MTSNADAVAQHRDRTSRELGRAGNHPDAITAFLDRYEAAVRATALREAADDLQQYIDTEWAGPDRESARRLWWQPRVDRLRDLANAIDPAA